MVGLHEPSLPSPLVGSFLSPRWIVLVLTSDRRDLVLLPGSLVPIGVKSRAFEIGPIAASNAKHPVNPILSTMHKTKGSPRRVRPCTGMQTFPTRARRADMTET